MIKIDLITGFLGSGKTTFIREYAKYLMQKGEKICIIENDYGAVNIDMVLLQDLYGDNCNLEMIIGGDGKEAHRRRFRTKLISMGMSGYDRVIIEPSGIYDVDEFFDVLYDEPLDRWYEIGSVISIVDANTVKALSEDLSDKNDTNIVREPAEDLFAADDSKLVSDGTDRNGDSDISRYIFMSEIAGAGKVVISKLPVEDCNFDDGNREGAEALPNTMISGNAYPIVEGINRILAEFGLGGDKPWFDPEKDIIAKPFSELSEEDFAAVENCGYRHASYVKIPVEDQQYNPLFYFDVEMPKEKLSEIATQLFADEKAGHIIRIKGFVKTGEDAQVRINATEKGVEIAPVVSSRNVVIIIGEGLDKEYINEVFKDYCSQVSL